MPNHVSNYVEIRGKLDELKKFWIASTHNSENKETGFNYNNLVPEPTTGKIDLYKWHCTHWGNKWGRYNIGVNKEPIDTINCIIKFHYDTLGLHQVLFGKKLLVIFPLL